MMSRLLIVIVLLLAPSAANAAFNFQSYGGWTGYAQYAREEAVTHDDYGSCYGQGWDMDCGAPAISCASVATNAGLSDQNNAWCEQRWTSTMMSYYYDTDGILNAFYDHEHRITVYGPGSSYLGCYGSQCSQHHSTAPPASVTLGANPTTIIRGNSSILSWSSYDATSCTGTGFSTGGATSGQVTVTPNATTNYSISCTGPGGSGSSSRTVTVVTPQCSDGIDNDSDGLIDMGDWGCTSPTDTTEYHSGSSYTVPGQCGETGVPATINCIAAEPVSIDCSPTQRAYYEPYATSKNCFAYNGYSHTTNWGTCSEDASCSSSGGCYCNGHWRWNGHNWDDYGVSWEPGDPAGCQMSPNPLGTYSYTDYSIIEYRDGTIYGSGYGPETAIGSYSTSGCNAPSAPGSASGLTASCNAAGTAATLSWSATSGADGYYVRASNPGSCPAGWTQASWSSVWCTPSPDWVSGTSVTFPTTPSTSYSWGIHAANSGGYGPWTPGSNFSCTPSAPQCSDSINNDGDAWTDYPNDPGCTSASDETESPNPQCSDGVDNDGDGATDTADTGCDGTSDDSESPNPQCSDGVNNDGSEDASVDYPTDAGCASASDTSESPNPVVGPPVASIDADPTRVNQGEQSDISFSASNVATSCTVTGSDGYTSGAIAGPTIATTTVARTITTQTTFRITCDGVADDEDVVVVNVAPIIGEF